MAITDVGGIVDRVRREFIYPADQQPPVVFLSSAIDETVTGLTVTNGTLTVDERTMLAPGVAIEIDRELMLITSAEIGDTTITLTVKRGWQGTEAASHSAAEVVYVAPDVTRGSIFDAVGIEIVALWPHLWAIESVSLTSDSDPVTVTNDVAQIQHYRYMASQAAASSTNQWKDGYVRLMREFNPDDPATYGQAIAFDGVPEGRTGILTYRKKFSRPAAETELLTDLGIEQEWLDILTWGAASRVVGQRDPSKLSVEWVSEYEENRTAGVGAASSLGARLRGAADAEKQAATRRWRELYPTTVRRTQPLRPWAGV